jgi:hypothetical protein
MERNPTMSKEITTGGWVSVIPDQMYSKWVKKGWIEKGYVHFGEGDETRMGGKEIMEKEIAGKADWPQTERQLAGSKSEVKRLETLGFKRGRKQFYVKPEYYEKMRNEIGAWYDVVFDYVNKWLETEKLACLERGSFNGGFCAETNPDHEVVKNWGAPLAKPENKVIQVKEKFGRIVVYFGGLTKEESTKVKKFSKHCEKKFDCCADFV